MPNPNVPNRSLHASYEIIAKNIAGNASASSPADLRILGQYGYVIDRVFNDPVTDLQAVGLRSTNPNKPPLLVFAGTSSALGQLENKNPQGAGFKQFTQNRAAIETWLKSIATDTTKNPKRLLPDLAGHSLGGALVQQTAAALPTLISEAVTFQSFGLNSGITNKFKQNGGVVGQVTHYVSSGDLVSLMGQEFIAGAAILTTYTTPAIDPQNFIQKHFEYIVPNSTATQTATHSYQELGTDKLNSPNFNYTDRDWIDLRLAISQTDSFVAKGLIDRQSAEGLRLQLDYFALADRIGKLNLLAGYNASGGVDTLPGAGGYNLTGTPGNDSLVGGTGNDVLDSVGGGIDTLVGGKGDDTYGIYNSADIITENPNEGTDTVWTAVNYILPGNVENMYLVGSVNGTGNAGDNKIVGNGAGDNVINGGGGSDTLTGGAGKDTFVFDSRNLISQVISGVDTITDFTIGKDKIQLSKLAFNTNLRTIAGNTVAGNALVAGDFMTVTNDAAAATATKAIVYNRVNGHLFYNANLGTSGFGTNGGQFAQLAVGLNLTNTDFSLIAGSNPPI
jgi:serralysin